MITQLPSIENPKAFNASVYADSAAKKLQHLAGKDQPFECGRFRTWPDKQGLSHWPTKTECIERHRRFKAEGPSYHPCAICSTAATWARYAHASAKLAKQEEPPMPKPKKDEEVPMKKCNRCKKMKSRADFRKSEFMQGACVATCMECEEKYKLGPWAKKQGPDHKPPVVQVPEVGPSEDVIHQPVTEQEPEVAETFNFDFYKGDRPHTSETPTITISQQKKNKDLGIYISTAAGLLMGIKKPCWMEFGFDKKARVLAIRILTNPTPGSRKMTFAGPHSGQVSCSNLITWAGITERGTWELEKHGDMFIVRLKTENDQAA